MQNGPFKNYILYYWIMFIDKLQLFMVGFIYLLIVLPTYTAR